MRTKTWVAVGAVAAVAALAVPLVHAAESKSGGANVTANSNGSCSASDRSSCVINAIERPDTSDDDLVRQAESNKARDPEGPGPWLFAVVGDGGVGLKVRNTGLKDGTTIGGLKSHHPAWVRCRTDTGFDPEGAGNSIWYEITWPKDAEPGTIADPDANATGAAWAYSKYLLPQLTNANVPECSVGR